MKNLDLNAMGVNEMSEVEMKQVDGGIIPFVIAVVVLWFLSTQKAQ